MATLILNPEADDSRVIHLDKPSMLIGSAADADIQLESESVTDHHARIEHKPDGYYIISLDGSILVNGTEITFHRLHHGDPLEIGDVHAVLLAEEEATVHEGPVHADPMPLARAHVQAPVHVGAAQCPHCGMPVTPGIPSCPHCGAQLSTAIGMPMGYIPPVPPGQVGAGILPVIAFLAALSVVGAPIALVLGLMCLAIIKKRGGTVRDRALSRWSLGLGFLWIILGTAGGILLANQAKEKAQIVSAKDNEGDVIEALKNLARAQKYAHTIEYFDADEDGHGEYAELDVLAEVNSQYYDNDLSDGEAFGYRFSIREASEDQFLAVAEPLEHGVDGLKIFSIAQSGRVCGKDSEGMSYEQMETQLSALDEHHSAYFERDDEIAQDVLNYVKSLSSSLEDQEKAQRIIRRLRKDYALTIVGQRLQGLEDAVDHEVTEMRAKVLYMDVKDALEAGEQDSALAKLQEIVDRHPSFSMIASVEEELRELRAGIAQQHEQAATALLAQAEELERSGEDPEAVEQLYDRIDKLYPGTQTADRIALLRPQLQIQMRERKAEDIFSDLMELSPERDYEEILNRANQLKRNYKDTDLFGKVQTELAAKERKARANSWRAKTEQNMAAGRMRGALAQLESAARENPDLLYDLRDLCITLYRSVADTLMEEGDARKALGYYEKLSSLLQASGSGEQVDPDLLAKLHNDVGQADFGLKEYEEARWHFASAGWKYQGDAPFNMRLGAASLYTGLYRPAKTALDQALSVQTDLAPALLYRAYLNIRVVLASERVLAGGFKMADAPENTGDDESDTPEPAPQNLIVSVDSTGEDDDDVTVNTTVTEAGDSTIAGPQNLDLKSSDARDSWFSQFAENTLENGSAVPEPTDLNLFLDFDYHGSSSSILLTCMQFLEDLELQKTERELAASTGRYNAAMQALARQGSAARKQSRMQMEASEKKNTSKFHSQLRELRAFHLEDADARNELYDMMDDMAQRLHAAKADIQAAGMRQPRIQSLTENVLSQIAAKEECLNTAEKMISSAMKDEVMTRKQMLALAEKMLLEDSSTSSKRYVARFRNKLFDEDSVIEINKALRALRESMDVQVDLNNILRAAEGNGQSGQEAL